MQKEAAISTENEYDRLLQIVLSGLEHGHRRLSIWKSSNVNFESPS